MDLRNMEKFVWYITFNRMREDMANAWLRDDITEQGVKWGITFTDAQEERLQKAIKIVQDKIQKNFDNINFMRQIRRLAENL